MSVYVGQRIGLYNVAWQPLISTLATIYDARLFSVGRGLGLDYLADPDRRQWIYHRKPWFGVSFGLNLNQPSQPAFSVEPTKDAPGHDSHQE